MFWLMFLWSKQQAENTLFATLHLGFDEPKWYEPIRIKVVLIMEVIILLLDVFMFRSIIWLVQWWMLSSSNYNHHDWYKIFTKSLSTSLATSEVHKLYESKYK